LEVYTNAFDSEIFEPLINSFRVDFTLSNIWKELSSLDKHINDNEPWGINDNAKLQEVLTYEINTLRKIAILIEPFIPDAAKKIQNQFNSSKIYSALPLFPRI